MFKVQKIWLAAALLVVAAGANADGHPTITIPEETFSVQGELMNLELSDGGGVITVAAIAGKYGRVFLTYNMSTNPNSKTQGSFMGRGMGIDDTGNREFAVRAGVWTRSGTTLTLHSLDDLTDGTQNLCKSELNLTTGDFQMTFYPM
ncbi:MAG: hypothetical protein CMP83_01990 [Gammaproteobacteria bacterium]|nr:hypothetical protein [Gammaproteobacteria bacterium]